MSRMTILQNSLSKKEQVLNDKIEQHFATVREANGQPLNDKRCGQATLKRWGKQSDGISKQLAEIEKTKRAIEREQAKIDNVNAVTDQIPPAIMAMVEQGRLTQWRKYPNRFFVKGVEKARLVVDLKTKQISAMYVNQIPNQEQLEIFKAVAKELSSKQ